VNAKLHQVDLKWHWRHTKITRTAAIPLRWASSAAAAPTDQSSELRRSGVHLGDLALVDESCAFLSGKDQGPVVADFVLSDVISRCLKIRPSRGALRPRL